MTRLTKHELAVLAMRQEGASIREIAARFGIKQTTARMYLHRLRLKAAGPSGEVGLSNREREVAELMRRGLRDAEIADELGIQVRTAESHAREVLRKIGVPNRRAMWRQPMLFTRRELEVGRLAAQGLSDPAIADRLGVSPRTVEDHLSAVLSKAGLSRRAQLERVAILLGVEDSLDGSVSRQ